MVEVSTSILNVIGKENPTKIFYDLEVARTDYYHIDVMDGKFVERNTAKEMYEFSNTIKQITNLPLDVHLMVDDVKEHIEQYISLEPHYITIHYEACKNKEEVKMLLNLIKENNIKCGLSIKPTTNIEEIYEFLPKISLCLIMSVEPGKGGQKFIETSLQRVKQLKYYLEKQKLETYIEVDGGIGQIEAEKLKQAGADILVVRNGNHRKRGLQKRNSRIKKVEKST